MRILVGSVELLDKLCDILYIYLFGPLLWELLLIWIFLRISVITWVCSKWNVIAIGFCSVRFDMHVFIKDWLAFFSLLQFFFRYNPPKLLLVLLLPPSILGLYHLVVVAESWCLLLVEFWHPFRIPHSGKLKLVNVLLPFIMSCLKCTLIINLYCFLAWVKQSESFTFGKLHSHLQAKGLISNCFDCTCE